MTIEQVLTRSLKTSGGLTRGRGISPSTIAKWVHSMPAASRVIDAMETFGGVACVTSEQHVDLRESNQKRDHADTPPFLTWLNLHHPFQVACVFLHIWPVVLWRAQLSTAAMLCPLEKRP